jgi:hypothetical protein
MVEVLFFALVFFSCAWAFLGAYCWIFAAYSVTASPAGGSLSLLLQRK